MNELMKIRARPSVPLGELVVAAFDEAARFSDDPQVVAALATRVVARVLRGGRRRASTPPQ